MAAPAKSDMSYWIKFFTDAGIPAGDAANYAVTFTDNRISRSMLTDLTKEYLQDMGIGILGDIISILKHAKSVHTQDVREKALQGASRSGYSTPPTPKEITVTAPAKRSTPASRTIEHYINERSNSPLPAPSPSPSPKISKELSARLGAAPTAPSPTPSGTMRSDTLITLNKKPKESVPVPKNRRVFPEHEGKYKVSMPTGSTQKTRKILEQQRQKAEQQRIKAEAEKQKKSGVVPKMSVFSRLGSEVSTTTKSSNEPTITITGLGNLPLPASSAAQGSVFRRLGGKSTVKRAATSTVTFDDDEDVDESDPALEYAGVLKESPSKKAKMEAAKKLKKNARRMLTIHSHTTREHTEPVSTTAGILSPEAGKQQKQTNIRARLGPKVPEVSSTTGSPTAVTTKGSKVTLGNTKIDTSLKVKVGGIFGRLGKPTS